MKKVRVIRCLRCLLGTVRSREAIGKDLAQVATDAAAAALKNNPGDNSDARACRNAHALGWIEGAMERLAVELQRGCCQSCAGFAPALGVA